MGPPMPARTRARLISTQCCIVRSHLAGCAKLEPAKPARAVAEVQTSALGIGVACCSPPCIIRDI